MEQRREVRKQSDLGAVISCSRFGLFRGSIENLSEHGMYVRTRNVMMCLHVPVTVTFQPEQGLPLLHCDVEGLVVHQGRDGFGVRLRALDVESRRAIRRLCDRLTSVEGEQPLPRLAG